ncbi:MAG: SulP family inorganic anion transporter [Candidatus Eiseniibacteriota bacterium]
MARFDLGAWIPGLALARHYPREWLRPDLVAGVSLAAVALPIGIAYAQLAGFPPVFGIYSSILPAVAYALFGSSRQLVVNPDAASCTIVAATIAPLALGDGARALDLSIALGILTGLLCIAGGVARLGVIANFLSRPILTGYLNGIALSILASQLGNVLGFHVPSEGFFRTVANAASRLSETHLPTLALALGLFVLLRLLKQFAPRVPAPLVVAILGGVLLVALGLERLGVAVVGAVPAGFPVPRIPRIAASEIGTLFVGALGVALVSYCSMMTTARGFASRNGYEIDPNRDMTALGISDLASALSRGFVVSGADSRTAVADASGGKSQLTSVVAALVMALVLLFATTPLASLPIAALAAILVSAALGLFDLKSLRQYARVSPAEFVQSVVATLGVMTLGVLQGVVIAVGLALLRLLVLASRPHDEVLGLVEDPTGLRSATKEEGGRPEPGLVIYRFHGAPLFFNSDRFLDRARAVAHEAGPAARWFLLDAEAMPILDVTGAQALETLHDELARSGIRFGVARASGLFRSMLERSGLAAKIGETGTFRTVGAGALAFRRSGRAG